MLNLGIEGMMIMGAACGFAGAYFTNVYTGSFTGSVFVGALCGMARGGVDGGDVRRR